MLFVCAKHSKDAADSLSGVDGVKRGIYDMPGLGGRHRDFHSLPIANFANEDDLGRLAQSGAKTAREIGKILAELALMKNGAPMRMQEFDRIFERDNVNWFGVIYFVEHGGQRGRFATAGTTGNKDNAGPFLDDFAKDRWQAKLLDSGNLRLQTPQDQGMAALLLEDVDAKSGQIFKRITAIA